MTSSPQTLDGKTCLVTGATGTIGAIVACRLAEMGAELVLVARDPTRGEAVRHHVVEQTGSERVGLLTADLADRESIKLVTTRFMAEHAKLHLLVHAAATFEPIHRVTEGGPELTWATNVLGPYQLTARLLEMMRYCAPSRVIFLASAHAGGLDLSDPNFEKRRYSGWGSYMASQQAIRMLAWLFAAKLGTQQVAMHVVDPGSVRASGARPSLLERTDGPRGLAARLVRRAAGISPEDAAEAVVAAATDPALSGGQARLLRSGQPADCPWRAPDGLEHLFTSLVRSTRVRPDFESSAWREDISVVLDRRMLE